jgi:hypothetical protein
VYGDDPKEKRKKGTYVSHFMAWSAPAYAMHRLASAVQWTVRID